MLAFIFWIGLSATTLLMLASAADEAVRRVRASPRSSVRAPDGLVMLSLVRAGATRVDAASGHVDRPEKAAA